LRSARLKPLHAARSIEFSHHCRGDTVRVDVVVRTKDRSLLPGGTVDAYDTWLELKPLTTGTKPFLEWNGRGQRERASRKGAHFYRSGCDDEHGNVVNKRNAWSSVGRLCGRPPAGRR
jgi:hypothetical protein